MRDRAGLGQVGAIAEIAVAAGLAERLARNEHPGTRDQALLHRLLVTEVGAGAVADRGEAAHQRSAQHLAGAGVNQRRQLGGIAGLARADDRRDRMHVAVDQPGHERAPAEVHHFRLGRRNRALFDGRDLAPAHKHLKACAKGARVNVEKCEVLEQDLGHFSPLARPGIRESPANVKSILVPVNRRPPRQARSPRARPGQSRAPSPPGFWDRGRARKARW